jgi:DNA-binding response OmpR family regulator
VNAKKKILIIDDEPDIVTFLTALLEDNGYAPISAKDGQEGMDITRTEHPDLILLDITMP